MTRLVIHLLVALAVLVVSACEPTEPPAFARRSATPAASPVPSAPSSAGASANPGASVGTSAGASATAGAPTGSPRIEVAGSTITIVGQGDKNTDIIPLDGTYEFVSTPCPGTLVIPFVWVYEEFGAGRGTYVDAVFTVKNLKGNFYLRISGPPTCDWTVVLTKTA